MSAKIHSREKKIGSDSLLYSLADCSIQGKWKLEKVLKIYKLTQMNFLVSWTRSSICKSLIANLASIWSFCILIVWKCHGIVNYFDCNVLAGSIHLYGWLSGDHVATVDEDIVFHRYGNQRSQHLKETFLLGWVQFVPKTLVASHTNHFLPGCSTDLQHHWLPNFPFWQAHHHPNPSLLHFHPPFLLPLQHPIPVVACLFSL